MPRSQKGFIVQVAVILVLLIGVVGGVYLAKNPQILRSRASELPRGLSVSPSNIKAGQNYRVSWRDINPASSEDFVGLYKTGENDYKKSVIGFYTSSCNIYPGRASLSKGQCPLSLPSYLPSGNYEWKIFQKNNPSVVVSSASVNIDQTGSATSTPTTPTPTVSVSNIPFNAPTCYSAIEECDSGQGVGSGTMEGWGKLVDGKCVITNRVGVCQQKPLGKLTSTENCTSGKCPFSTLRAQCQLGQLVLSWNTKGVNDVVYSAVRVKDLTDNTQVNLDNVSAQGKVTVKAISKHSYDWWVHPVFSDKSLGEAVHSQITCPDLMPLNEGSYCTYFAGSQGEDNNLSSLFTCKGVIKDKMCFPMGCTAN